MRRLLTSTALLLGILAVNAPAQEPPSEPTAKPSLAPQLAAHGVLEWRIRQIRPSNDHALVVRGELVNPYDEPVADIEVFVRLLTASQPPRELEQLNVRPDGEIPPRGRVVFDRELTTGYAKKASAIEVVAFAHRRGDHELPQPGPELVHEAAGDRALFYAGDIPYPNCPVGISPGAAN